MKIVVHGNCQATAIATLMREACGHDHEINSYEVFSIDLEKDRHEYISAMQCADIVVAQPVNDNYRGVDFLSLSWIRANIRSEAKIITVPVVYHRSLILSCFPLAKFYNGRLAYHDAHAVQYFLEGRSVDDFVSDSSGERFFSPDFVRSELLITTQELLTREYRDKCDVRVSDLISAHLTCTQPLLTVNHPSRLILACLINRIFELLQWSYIVPLQGVEPLDHFILPPYISTVLALEHSGDGLRMDEVRVDSHWEGRLQYFENVFNMYREIGAKELKAAVDQRKDMCEYLSRYSVSTGPRFHNIYDDRQLIEQLYVCLLKRRPNAQEVLHHLRRLRAHGLSTLVNSFTSSDEFLSIQYSSPS